MSWIFFSDAEMIGLSLKLLGRVQLGRYCAVTSGLQDELDWC